MGESRDYQYDHDHIGEFECRAKGPGACIKRTSIDVFDGDFFSPESSRPQQNTNSDWSPHQPIWSLSLPFSQLALQLSALWPPRDLHLTTGPFSLAMELQVLLVPTTDITTLGGLTVAPRSPTPTFLVAHTALFGRPVETSSVERDGSQVVAGMIPLDIVSLYT